MQTIIYTIGHSNLDLDKFIHLLKKFKISLVLDVRSQPFSKRHPQFNKDRITLNLERANISYKYRGDKLGGRPKNQAYYIKDVVSYQLLSSDAEYCGAIKELISIASEKNVALMCSEKDPINCHRALLIGRSLKEKNIRVLHILSDGGIESQEDIEMKLLGEDSGQRSIFGTEEMLDSAYKLQSEKVAFKLS